MGLVADMLEFVRGTSGDAQVSECKVDPGGEDNSLAHLYQPAGVDCHPMPGDLCLLVPGPEKGSWLVAGFIDPNNAGTAEAGEVRLYARDGDGGVAATIRIRSNADVHLGADIAEELIARADRTEKQLKDIETAHNDHVHTGTGYQGATLSIQKPLKTYTAGKVGCDRVYGT